MSQPLVLYEERDAVALITYNRPKRAMPGTCR